MCYLLTVALLQLGDLICQLLSASPPSNCACYCAAVLHLYARVCMCETTPASELRAFCQIIFVMIAIIIALVVTVIIFTVIMYYELNHHLKCRHSINNSDLISIKHSIKVVVVCLSISIIC